MKDLNYSTCVFIRGTWNVIHVQSVNAILVDTLRTELHGIDGYTDTHLWFRDGERPYVLFGRCIDR